MINKTMIASLHTNRPNIAEVSIVVPRHWQDNHMISLLNDVIHQLHEELGAISYCLWHVNWIKWCSLHRFTSGDWIRMEVITTKDNKHWIKALIYNIFNLIKICLHCIISADSKMHIKKRNNQRVPCFFEMMLVLGLEWFYWSVDGLNNVINGIPNRFNSDFGLITNFVFGWSSPLITDTRRDNKLVRIQPMGLQNIFVRHLLTSLYSNKSRWWNCRRFCRLFSGLLSSFFGWRLNTFSSFCFVNLFKSPTNMTIRNTKFFSNFFHR